MHRIPIGLTLAIALLAGCSGSASPDAGAQKMEVRVYPVPAGQTDALAQTLNKVFATAENSAIGKVSSPAPGQLVVLAPANLQGSIEASLRALTADPASPVAAAPAQQIRLSFWSVDAVPENGPDDLELATIGPALEAVRKQLGGVRFVLREQVGAVSSPGKTVTRSWLGTKLISDSPSPVQKLQYELRSAGSELMLDLSINEQVPVVQASGVQYLDVGANTTTAIRLGQSLVVTQTPIPKNAMASGEVSLSDRATRLYIVRADAVSTP